jgi:AhpD family alkylhydroperoxidase
MVLGQMVMVLVMVITSLHMRDHNHMLGDISIVISAHTVGMYAFSIISGRLADRWGRVRSITLMAVVWSLATVACGMATSYTELLAARAVVGFGEAACGAAGAALLAHAFPERQRATVLGAFQSAAMFGSVLGVVLGGAIAAIHGWRMAFFIVGAPGLLFAVLYPIFVRDYRTVKLAGRDEAAGSAGEKAASAAPESVRDQKRTLTRDNLVATLVNFVASAPALVRGLLTPRTSRALREKVVLAVTAINDCRYCAWGHTHWAMAHGVSLEEVNQILGHQTAQMEAKDPAEAAAILFAQHYAEHRDQFDPDAIENLRKYYSEAQVEEILAYVRAITLGNLTGNTVDAFLGRFRSHGHTSIFFEGAIAAAVAPIFVAVMMVSLLNQWRKCSGGWLIILPGLKKPMDVMELRTRVSFIFY